MPPKMTNSYGQMKKADFIISGFYNKSLAFQTRDFLQSLCDLKESKHPSMMIGAICESAGFHPSSPKTLPPTTMDFGSTETSATIHHSIKCLSSLQKRQFV
jgi:hypothetical protein